MPSKTELEALIAQKWTLGNFIFDEVRQCFLGNMEIVLYIARIAEETYRLVGTFFGGYEVWEDEEHETPYRGAEQEVKQKVVEARRMGEEFMGYPIVFSGIVCRLSEEV
ncbi:hypothetical protein [Deinococcus sp.]|uniref:hypothetical protein n=1 Tax=Deinococcus sp. TaxID=47478 RepID=UPI003C7E6AFC